LRSGLADDEGDIKPERRCKAKWDSLFKMLVKWEKMRAPMARIDPSRWPESVTEKIPTAEERVTLETLTRELADFQSVSKALQGAAGKKVNRYESRNMFDRLLAKYGDGRNLKSLKKNASIVNDPNFENAIVKIQGGQESTLNPSEKAAVRHLLKVPEVAGSPNAEIPTRSFADSILEDARASKSSRTETSKYRSTDHVAATSNICERLLSQAKLIMSDLRRSMDPDTLSKVLFLKGNPSLWLDITVIDEIIAEVPDA
jgi:hypothetical protein